MNLNESPDTQAEAVSEWVETIERLNERMGFDKRTGLPGGPPLPVAIEALTPTPSAEPDGEGERWECGPHANAWNGHDARCRRITTDAPASDQPEACVVCGHASGTAQPGLCPAHEYDDGPLSAPAEIRAPCIICRRPEVEHRDRSGHGFAAAPAQDGAEIEACPKCARSGAYHGVVVEPGEASRWACDECGHSAEVEALGHDERLTRGLYSHIHRGECPDQYGWDRRDPECTACSMLDEMLTRFNRPTVALICPECEAETFQCSACGARVDLLTAADAAVAAKVRRTWERSVLEHVLANAPANRPDGDVTPDWIGAISTAMLATRAAAPAGEQR